MPFTKRNKYATAFKIRKKVAPMSSLNVVAASAPAAQDRTNPSPSIEVGIGAAKMVEALTKKSPFILTEKENEKLKHIFEICVARLQVKKDIKESLETGVLNEKEMQNLWIQQYNTVLKDEKLKIKTILLNIVQDHIVTYEKVLELLNNRTKESIFMIAILFKYAAFSYPQFEQARASSNRKNIAKEEDRSSKENIIFRNLYQQVYSLLDEDYQLAISSCQNTRFCGLPSLNISKSFDGMVKILTEIISKISEKILVFYYFQFDEKHCFGKNDFSELMMARFFTLFTESGLRFQPSMLLPKNEAAYGAFVVDVGKSIIHYGQTASFILQLQSLEISTRKSGHIVGLEKSLQQELPKLDTLMQYFSITKQKLKVLYRKLSEFVDKIEKYNKQERMLVDATGKITKFLSILTKMVGEKDKPISPRSLDNLKKYIEETEIFLLKIEETRKLNLSYLAQADFPKREASFHYSVPEYAHILDEAIQPFFDGFEHLTNTSEAHASKLSQFYLAILKEMRQPSSTPERTLQTQIEAVVVEKVVSHVQTERKLSKDEKFDPTQTDWKKFVEENRLKRDLERKKRQQEAAAEAIMEARTRQAAAKLAFELSSQEIKKREEVVATFLTKSIRILLEKLYNINSCGFCCNDLIQLISSLKQQGCLMGMESPSGGSSHFSIYICTEEYLEKGGAFYTEDWKERYPLHIINGLRRTFSRAGFTQDILLLEKPAASDSLLVMYSDRQQQRQLQIVGASPAAAAGAGAGALPAKASSPTSAGSAQL